jgi:hypothetical protein
MTMRTPPTFVIFRAAAAAITLLALLLFGLGLARLGPASSLGGLTEHATSWLRLNTGVGNR